MPGTAVRTLAVSLALLLGSSAILAGDLTKIEQQERLQKFQKLYKSPLASNRALACKYLADVDEIWSVQELIKVLQREAASKKREDAMVVDAAVRALGRTRNPAAVRILMDAVLAERRAEIRNPIVESLAGISLNPEDDAELDWGPVDEQLRAALKSEDWEERVAALDAVGVLRRSDFFDDVAPNLEHSEWQVRGTAVTTIQKIFDKEHPRGLRELVQRMKEERGRLLADIADALTSMTGWTCGREVDCWELKVDQFMRSLQTGDGEGPRLGERTAQPEDDTPQTSAQFFDIELESERILFLVDISSSMLERYEGADDYRRPRRPQDDKDDPHGRRFAKSGEVSKWDVAREELRQAVESLKPSQSFNIFFFGDGTEKFQPDLRPADERWKKKAFKKMDSLTPSERAQTNMYGVLSDAFNAAGAGVRARSGAVGIDTMILFTDGFPTTGEISLTTPRLDANGQQIKGADGKVEYISVVECYSRIASIIRRINRYGKVRIHCVGIGEHAEKLLSDIAKDSSGQYRVAEKVLAKRAQKAKEAAAMGDGDAEDQ